MYLVPLRRLVATGLFVALGGLVLLLPPLLSVPGPTPPTARLGSPSDVLHTYTTWQAAQPETQKMLVGLTWFKGLSSHSTPARGTATLNLGEGTVAVTLYDLPAGDAVEVWLVDNRPGPAHSVKPEPHDRFHLAGTLVGGATNMVTHQYSGIPTLADDFDVDVVAVTAVGQHPTEGGLLFGMPTLFQRLERQSQRVRAGLPPDAGTSPEMAIAYARTPADRLQALMDLGEDLFMNETFDGNGRTCATCHPPTNNFTIDVPFIASLPPDDPLFVAEYMDALNADLNGGLVFEDPDMLRALGLIVVNADGTDDLANKYVLRSVSHTFAQALSMTPTLGQDETTVPPVHRLGWGGDGAPGNGSLREFAIGAVVQHTPLSLDRVAGVDYRLPTDEELDAIETFLLSLGRQNEYDLEGVVFLDPDVEMGRAMYVKSRDDGGIPAAKCHRCHGNGGAMREPGVAGGEMNWNFDIGTRLVDHPAVDLVGRSLPPDAGFGVEPNLLSSGYGTNKFNTPSVIEAADTAPFFHNNAVGTLEEAVNFYTSDEFNFLSEEGNHIREENEGIPITLSALEVNQVAAVLRVLNAIDNIRLVQRCIARTLDMSDNQERLAMVPLCRSDNEDALQVLQQSPLSLHTDVQSDLGASLAAFDEAAAASTRSAFEAALTTASEELAGTLAKMMAERELPVELIAFTAHADGADMVLRWTTARETNNAGFEVLHQHADASAAWTSRGFVSGHGTTQTERSYTYRLADLAPGTHRFRLRQVDHDGHTHLGTEVEVTLGTPAMYQLSAPYPNPAREASTFTLAVQRTQAVRIQVYDALGRRVAVLHNGPLGEQQTHTFRVDGDGWPAGRYLIDVQGETFRATHHLTQIR